MFYKKKKNSSSFHFRLSATNFSLRVIVKKRGAEIKSKVDRGLNSDEWKELAIPQFREKERETLETDVNYSDRSEAVNRSIDLVAIGRAVASAE